MKIVKKTEGCESILDKKETNLTVLSREYIQGIKNGPIQLIDDFILKQYNEPILKLHRQFF